MSAESHITYRRPTPLALSALTTWADTSPPEALARSVNASLADEPPAHDPPRFPCDAALNAKIILWQGDVRRLDVDAVVNETNESLRDRSGLSGALFAAAGPDLEFECAHTEGCRTGDAVLTKGGALPARYVIHTVGPRYNKKYHTAAENALHNCYRNIMRVLKENKLRTLGCICVYSVRKTYPRAAAAHIALRTVRRFLERYGKDVDTVVLCVDGSEVGDGDLAVYQRTLPLYFPRNALEERLAERPPDRGGLPADVGNEIGETVIADRAIRIGGRQAAGSGRAQSPTARYGGGSNIFVGRGPQPYAKGKRPNVPSATFTAMREDPDAARLDAASKGKGKKKAARKASAAGDLREAAALAGDELYAQWLERARIDDLSDVAALNLLYVSGVDAEGRPIVVFCAAHMPTEAVDLDRVVRFVIRCLDELVSRGEYVLVYVHSNLSTQNKPDFGWLKRVYRTVLARKYKKNLKELYVVFPDFWVKMCLMFLSPFVSKKLKTKTVHVERVADLFAYFDATQLSLPEHIFRADDEIQRGGGGGAAAAK